MARSNRADGASSQRVFLHQYYHLTITSDCIVLYSTTPHSHPAIVRDSVLDYFLRCARGANNLIYRIDFLHTVISNVSSAHPHPLRLRVPVPVPNTYFPLHPSAPRRRMQHVETRELYAIKVFSVFDREKRAQLLKEVETLCGMDCPSLVGFVGGYLKVRACDLAFAAYEQRFRCRTGQEAALPIRVTGSHPRRFFCSCMRLSAGCDGIHRISTANQQGAKCSASTINRSTNRTGVAGSR